MKTIDSAGTLSREQFNQTYFNKRPFVYKGAVKHTIAFNEWSPEYLRSAIGNRPVKVKYSESGFYNIAVKAQNNTITVPFDKALEFFSSREYVNRAYYLQQSSIFLHFPELLQDLDIPDLNGRSDKFSEINLWMGGAGCVTHLHYDRDQNFLVQVRGSKQLTLFTPEDSAYLYPNEGEGISHVSRIDLDRVDTAAFPLFQAAQPYHCTLESGDLLYIPPRWWHQVRSLAMSISVNYWWNRFDIYEGMALDQVDVGQLCQMIQAFVDGGFSIDHKDESGEILLLKAIRLGYKDVVEAFLLLGANPNSRSQVYAPGTPALSLAEGTGNAEIVKLLLQYGANDGTITNNVVTI